MRRFLWMTLWILAGTVIGSAQSVFYFPQIADGTQPGGVVWSTGIAVSNPGQPGTAVLTGTISFFTGNGTAFNLSFTDENKQAVGSGNQIFFNLGPGQSHFYQSTAAGQLNIGWARLTASGLVTGAATFAESLQGAPVAQAAVFSSLPQNRQATFAIEDDSDDTAIAIANPGSTLANISFTLLDTNGNTAGVVNNVILPAQNQVAEFVSALFPTIRPFHGTLQIVSQSAALVTTTLLFTTGGKFFTFPGFLLASTLNSPLEWIERRPWSTHLTTLARLWGSLRSDFAI